MASKPPPMQDLMQELLAPSRPEGSEDVKARLLFQLSSSLLDENSKFVWPHQQLGHRSQTD